MSRTKSQKLCDYENQLRSGRTPIINENFPGVEELLRRYGLEPNVDVAIPYPGETAKELAVRRKKLRGIRFYRRHTNPDAVTKRARARSGADKALDKLLKPR